MKKRKVSLTLLLIVVMLASGCQHDDQGNVRKTMSIAKAEDANVRDAVVAEEILVETAVKKQALTTKMSDLSTRPGDYVFHVDGTRIRPTEPASQINDYLVTALETGDAPSCVFEGLDKVFRFDGFEIQTGIVNGIEYITGVIILNDGIKTPEGLSIGMTLSDMIDRYGDDYTESFGQYIYEDDAVKFIVIVSEEQVITISYIGKFETIG